MDWTRKGEYDKAVSIFDKACHLEFFDGIDRAREKVFVDKKQ